MNEIQQELARLEIMLMNIAMLTVTSFVPIDIRSRAALMKEKINQKIAECENQLRDIEIARRVSLLEIIESEFAPPE